MMFYFIVGNSVFWSMFRCKVCVLMKCFVRGSDCLLLLKQGDIYITSFIL